MTSTRSIGIVYLNHGTKHLLRLVVSAMSLREYYQGPLTILETGLLDESLCSAIQSDSILNASIQKIDCTIRRRHTAYVAKASLWRHSPFDCTLYLDADTLVAKPIDLLFELANGDRSGFVVTHFANWVTTGKMISGRLNRWRGVECRGIDVAGLLQASFEYPHAHVNTGVFAWRTGAKILEPWERLTNAGCNAPFTDEYSCQLLLRRHQHVLVDDRWNCSPIYGKNKDKAAVWHFHGGKHVARDGGRGSQGHEIWWPKFTQAWVNNVACIRDWAPAGDPRIGPHLEELQRSAA